MKQLYQYIIICSAVLLCTNCQEKNNTVQSSIDKLKIKTIKVQKTEYQHTINTYGKISAGEEMALSFKTGGIISKIAVMEGDKVSKGQVLAKLNLSEIEAQVNQANLALEKSVRDFNRVRNLYEDSVATLEQYENIKTALEYAKSNVEIAKFNLKFSSIIAPNDGIVLKKLAKENEMIGPGYPVLYLGSVDQSWLLKVGLTDKEVVLVELGNKAKVISDAYKNTEFNARIIEIGQFADPYTGTFEVELEILNPEEKLISGLLAKAQILTNKTEDVYEIPYKAILEPHEKSGIVYILKKDSLIRTKIEIMKITDDGVLVSVGLDDGDKIVTDGLNYIRSGVDFEEIK